MTTTISPTTSPPTFTKDTAGIRESYLLPYRGPTRDNYEYHLDKWFTWCENRDLLPLEATRPYVELYIHDLGPIHAVSSVHAALTPVRGFYRFATAEGFILRDPALLARRPRVVHGLSDTVGLDRDQMQAFLHAGQTLGGRHHAVVYLVACMALRPCEACSIEIDDYQKTLRGHRVLEFTGKGGVPARMPLPVPVLRALDDARDGRDSGRLIRRQDGLPLGRQGFTGLVRTLGRRAGINMPVSARLLRHSCITNALESGASIRKVQDLARHSEPRTTMRYDRNRTNLDDHAVHALVAFVSPPEFLTVSREVAL